MDSDTSCSLEKSPVTPWNTFLLLFLRRVRVYLSKHLATHMQPWSLNSLHVRDRRCCCMYSQVGWIIRTGHRWFRMTFRTTWRGWGTGWWPWKDTQRDAPCCPCHCVWRGHKLKKLFSGQCLITMVTRSANANFYLVFIAPFKRYLLNSASFASEVKLKSKF